MRLSNQIPEMRPLSPLYYYCIKSEASDDEAIYGALDIAEANTTPFGWTGPLLYAKEVGVLSCTKAVPLAPNEKPSFLCNLSL